MVYLIIGTAVALIGLGLLMNKGSFLGFLGMIVCILGIAIISKGRRELDKFKLGK